MIGGPASSIASHCAAKSSSVASPASRATSEPQLPRNRRTASSVGLLLGGGPQRQYVDALTRQDLSCHHWQHMTVRGACRKQRPVFFIFELEDRVEKARRHLREVHPLQLPCRL